jgi:hypothetical protein
MEHFLENKSTNIEIKVVRGTITPEENELSDEYNLFYWANFIPHFNNKKILIIGECGFDTECEKTQFEFDYDIESDTIKMDNQCRKCICSEELCNLYSKQIRYSSYKHKTSEPQVLPWFRFPRTKDGIAIPLLIEIIMGKIPRRMVF